MPTQPDRMDPTYQRAVDDFVRREIYYCVSSLIHELATTPEYQDDLLSVMVRDTFTHEFTYECGCGHTWEVEDNDSQSERWDTFTDIPENRLADLTANCPECNEPNEPTDVRASESDPEEAYEHWIVSDGLARNLEEYGEMVVRDFLGMTIWGRTTTGQMISMDGVIQDIYDEMMRA